MKRLISIVFIALMALVILNSQPVLAEIVTIEVTGLVDELWTDNGLTLDGSVEIGTPMTGFCSYDTDTPDLFPQFDHRGEYQLISISMSVGNYTFTNDPMFPEAAVFRVGVAADFSYMAGSIAPRFDGTIYINSSPKTWDEVDLDTFGLCVLSLGGWNDYGITDALPDSFMDPSVYSYRSFGVGSSPDHIGPGFYISGELTSLTVVPEPATLLLLGLGGLALLRRPRCSK